ncbi:MAG TPA: SUMF1/EgtB/PvdO family nonheme iron enzyme [Burkholderiales bacterium]|nr:SUMF1/EgtB/PvdO family nonheme iron enzyme [Burkholderiales bacterium]
MPEAGSDRQLLTILFADAAGYSRLMAAQERGTLDTLKEYRACFREHVARSKGRVIDTAGDSILAVFTSPTAAVECAVAIQDELAQRNRNLPPRRSMEFRVGINLGDVITEGGAVYGDGVNVAARLEGLAESGGIMISGAVYELVRDKVDHLFVYEGRRRVKNISTPVAVYAVVPGHERASFLEKARRRKRQVVAAGAVAGALALAGVWYAIIPRGIAPSGEILPLRIFRDCPECPELVQIPPGAYERGSRPGEPGHFDSEGPVTRVTIKRSFAIGRYPVTFGEWDRCVSAGACKHRPNDRGWGRGTGPVFYVSWNDTLDYLGWLKVQTGKTYRLPSEAEWEYAARAGASTAYPWGDSAGQKMANCKGCSDGASDRTTPVGSFPPNRFNLFDMHGNVWQWVADCWNGSYAGAPADGSPRLSGECEKAAVRGGAWGLAPEDVRSARREGDSKDLRSGRRGFRIARDLP